MAGGFNELVRLYLLTIDTIVAYPVGDTTVDREHVFVGLLVVGLVSAVTFPMVVTKASCSHRGTAGDGSSF